MRLLPALIERPHFEPLRRFLTDDSDLRKRYQLAERLADLFDQYQVYRADWLKDWAAGEHILNTARGERKALPRVIAGRPNCGVRCWMMSVKRAWHRAAPGCISASSSVSTACSRHRPGCHRG